MEKKKPLRDEVVGRVSAGAGLFVAMACLLFVLDYLYLASAFLLCGFAAGYYFYVTSPNTVASIIDNKLRYGKSGELTLENITGVCIKRQFGVTDIIFVSKKGGIGDVIPLHGVPNIERQKQLKSYVKKLMLANKNIKSFAIAHWAASSYKAWGN